jgi:uncharacterized protein YqjF (DUF2071 family)
VNVIQQREQRAETPSAAARRRFLSREGAPLLLADWEQLVMLHFEIDAKLLQRAIPFELDLLDGRAFVSLVTFTMRRMRLAHGGRLARWLCAPLAEQRFLNVRTYVRHGEQTGIHFITEWISNGLCVPFGPLTYGLPYRWGRLNFGPDHHGGVRGRVEPRFGGAAFEYQARPSEGAWAFRECEPGTLTEFLVERYTGFTGLGGRRRLFRIWHEPWRMAEAEADWTDDSLLHWHLPWWRAARYVGANNSPGAFNIWMGRPRPL